MVSPSSSSSSHVLPHASGALDAWLRARVLYAVSFLDLLAVSMIIPSLSSYVKAMDGGALAFGGIMSMYGFIQFFAAPIAGSLSDIYGRRRVLLVCFVGAAVGYVLLGLSWNIYVVILSRIPCALFKHTLDIIKVAVTDAEDPALRSAAIGRLNAASNAGFIIGPIIGGFVSSVPNGFNYTAVLTAVLFMVNYALVALFFDEGRQRRRSSVSVDDMTAEKVQRMTSATGGSESSSSLSSSVDWKRLMRNARSKVFEFKNIFYETGPAKTLLLARLLLAMAAILYRTHFSTLLEDKFGTDSKSRGFVLSYMGLLGTFGSFAVGFATYVVRSERLLLQLSSVVYVMTFIALSKATTVEQIYLILIPQVVSISMLRASSIALQTTFVAQERVGAFMGVSSSLTSIGRTISPILSGWTYMFSIDGPAHGAALLAAISAALFCFSPHFASVGDANWSQKSDGDAAFKPKKQSKEATD